MLTKKGLDSPCVSQFQTPSPLFPRIKNRRPSSLKATLRDCGSFSTDVEMAARSSLTTGGLCRSLEETGHSLARFEDASRIHFPSGSARTVPISGSDAILTH